MNISFKDLQQPESLFVSLVVDNIFMSLNRFTCYNKYLGIAPAPKCSDKLGMENGDIADNQLTSTRPFSSVNGNCPKEYSRLNFADASIICNGFAPSTATTQGTYQYLYVGSIQITLNNIVAKACRCQKIATLSFSTKRKVI